MTPPKKDIAHSVRQRLMNVSKATGRPFQEVVDYYAMERFLYRLSRSSHAGKKPRASCRRRRASPYRVA